MERIHQKKRGAATGHIPARPMTSERLSEPGPISDGQASRMPQSSHESRELYYQLLLPLEKVARSGNVHPDRVGALKGNGRSEPESHLGDLFESCNYAGAWQ